MSALNNSLLLGQEGGGGYAISRSLRFNSSDSAYLSRTMSSASSTYTLSMWVKRSTITSNYKYLFSSGNAGLAFYNGTDQLYIFDGGTVHATTAVYRDTSAWYHILLSVSSNVGAAYVNGSQVLSGKNTASLSTASNATNIGRYYNSGSGDFYFDGYIADVYLIDGQALDPTSFGEFSATTGVWMPKAYSGGSYGTNGFHLDFSNNASAAALGTDSSGAGNTWTVNNLSVTAGAGNDSLVDVPTNGSEVDTGAGGQVRGNYCTLNPLNRDANANLANGNLGFSLASAGINYGTFSTFGVRTGKWYFEAAISSFISYGITTGFVTSDWGKDYIGSGGTAYFGLDTANGRRSSAGITSSGATVTFGAGDIAGVAFDADAGTATVYKNGTSIYTFSGIPANQYFPALSSGGSSAWINFGQRPFAYTAPSGFKALCTANLPAPVVTKPSTVMDVKLYTGNGSTQTISGLGFSPDLVWVKNRSSSAAHRLTDAVRGGGYSLFSNLTNAEVLNDANGYISSLNADGFTVTAGAENAIGVNQASNAYAAWAWDAGSSTVTNTAGSISSQVRANASAGFSIVTYTGNGNSASTVGHGLGVAPPLVIAKSRSTTDSWVVYTNIIDGSNDYLLLNSTAAKVDSSHSSPTSTVFNPSLTMGPSVTCVAYCFAPVVGYSSFGSVSISPVADGAFIYLGFRPKFLMLKGTDNTSNWIMLDSQRDPFNFVDQPLNANLSNAEIVDGATYSFDFVSNGVKVRNQGLNGNFIYCAWAESPFQYARAR